MTKINKLHAIIVIFFKLILFFLFIKIEDLNKLIYIIFSRTCATIGAIILPEKILPIFVCTILKLISVLKFKLKLVSITK